MDMIYRQGIAKHGTAENTRHGRNNIRLQSLELSNNMIREHIIASKAGNEYTNFIEQESLTDHEPKRIRGYDGTHVNMASYMTFIHGRNNNK